MTDSNCTRAGYDDTGRYRVPVVDQCPECRAAPGHPHNPACSLWKWPEEERLPQQNNDDCPVDCETRLERLEQTCPGCVRGPDIPLWQQAAVYAGRIDGVLDRLHALLAPGTDYRERIIEEGFQRLLEGYEHYRSEMYAYTPEYRARQMLEEIADYGVYGTSGDYR